MWLTMFSVCDLVGGVWLMKRLVDCWFMALCFWVSGWLGVSSRVFECLVLRFGDLV